jgi:hypothetical protein
MACSCCGDCGTSLSGQTIPSGMVTEIRQVASVSELRYARLRFACDPLHLQTLHTPRERVVGVAVIDNGQDSLSGTRRLPDCGTA